MREEFTALHWTTPKPRLARSLASISRQQLAAAADAAITGWTDDPLAAINGEDGDGDGWREPREENENDEKRRAQFLISREDDDDDTDDDNTDDDTDDDHDDDDTDDDNDHKNDSYTAAGAAPGAARSWCCSGFFPPGGGGGRVFPSRRREPWGGPGFSLQAAGFFPPG